MFLSLPLPATVLRAATDYDVHAVTDSIVLLFSKCQVYTHNHQGTEHTRTDFKELHKGKHAENFLTL